MPPPELILPSLVPGSCWPAGEEKSPPAADGCSPSIPTPSLSPSSSPASCGVSATAVPQPTRLSARGTSGVLWGSFCEFGTNKNRRKVSCRHHACSPCHICPISQRRARLARFIGDAKPRRRSELPAVRLPPRAASRQSLGEELALPHHAAGLPAAASLPPHEWTSRWGAPVSPPATSFMLRHRQHSTCFS